jgi:hypothetical protein
MDRAKDYLFILDFAFTEKLGNAAEPCYLIPEDISGYRSGLSG